MKSNRIYLDYNAATPIDPVVFDAYVQARKEVWGNASSSHKEGQASKALLAEARARIARLLHVTPHQIVFFSTATEALTTLIRSFACPSPSGHIITSVAEHAAVWQLCQTIQKEGSSVSFLPVGAMGAVDPIRLESAVTDQTSLISLMSVNNETGVMTDISRVAAIAYERRVPLVVDGVAQLGKAPFRLISGMSAACFSSYKIYAPCGVGFAVLAPGLALKPLIEGGGQESGRRGGSENVPAIYACSISLERLLGTLDESSERMARLRDLFEKKLFASCRDIHINGEGPRICNCSNLAFDGVDGEELLIQLDLAGVAASHGAACASGSAEASRVLLNMGFSLSRAHSSVRFSLGHHTTEEEIYRATDLIESAVRQLRR